MIVLIPWIVVALVIIFEFELPIVNLVPELIRTVMVRLLLSVVIVSLIIMILSKRTSLCSTSTVYNKFVNLYSSLECLNQLIQGKK